MNVNQNDNVEYNQNYNNNNALEDVSDVVNRLVNSVAVGRNSNSTCNQQQNNLQQLINANNISLNPHTSSQQRTNVKPTYEIFRSGIAAESHSGVYIVNSAITRSQELPALPPSYSTVMKQERFELPRDVRSMEIQHISPFRRIPPPSYSEIQGQWSRMSRDYSNSSSEQILFGPEPIFIWCNRCTTVVVSTTHSERSKFTHFTAAALCLLGCWPCALLPYCMNACKTTYHYCPDCNYLLGMYRPW